MGKKKEVVTYHVVNAHINSWVDYYGTTKIQPLYQVCFYDLVHKDLKLLLMDSILIQADPTATLNDKKKRSPSLNENVDLFNLSDLQFPNPSS